MALTDEHGHFEIRNLPAGSWRFVAWHERTGDLAIMGNAEGGLVEIRPNETYTLDLRQISEKDLTESP